ncbi:hypothetical protein DRN67_00790 [Candidatus Micrarchaeota archaeon]|nr:MAG: hypothetical protein DRN67_00790 [Candidatus Micrarchaeota archaeon]
MYEIIYLMAASALFGYFRKVADLLDEHGLKWFNGAEMATGIAVGILGAYLVSYEPVLANVILAMIAALIVRGKVDYINHLLASIIILLSFPLFAPFDYSIFISFFMVFAVFGAFKDQYDVRLYRTGWRFLLSEVMLHYPAITAAYGLLTSIWTPFIAFTLYTIGYDLTKLYYLKKGIG